MTDRGIRFSPAMVRALLSGRKTQTRRIIDFPGVGKVYDFVRVAFDKDTGVPVYEMKDEAGGFLTRPKGKNFVDHHYSPHFALGDRLWVREAWRSSTAYDDLPPSEMGGEEPIHYDADGSMVRWTPRTAEAGRLRASMHMPRWVSRLTLYVTDVRIERVGKLGFADALSEGMVHSPWQADWWLSDLTRADSDVACGKTAELCYSALWDHLNGERAGFAWADNPWVVVVSFKVEQRNIDQVQP